jgi:hypothetical protein
VEGGDNVAPNADGTATIKEVLDFFEYPTTAQARRDWIELTDEDKNDLKKGIGDGSLNY